MLQIFIVNTRILYMKTKTILSIITVVFLFSAYNAQGQSGARVTQNVSKKTSVKTKSVKQVKTSPAYKKKNKNAKKAGALSKSKTRFELALEKIKSADASQRGQGAREFARLRDKRAEKHLIAALKDESAIVRNSAVDALGLLRSKKAVAEIAKLLLVDPEENVRHAAAISLSYIGEGEAGESLIKAIDDKSASVRYAAIRTLAVLRYKKAEGKLIGLLKSEDINVRRSVINALGKINSKAAAVSIAKNYNDKDRYIRIGVAKALGEIGDIENIPSLKKMLKDKDAKVRIEAAYSLAKMNDESGLSMAHESLKSADMSIKQRSASIIGQIGGKESLKVLDMAYEAETNSNIKVFIHFSKERILSRIKAQEKK